MKTKELPHIEKWLIVVSRKKLKIYECHTDKTLTKFFLISSIKFSAAKVYGTCEVRTHAPEGRRS